MLQSIVLTFVRSKPEGATVPDVVKHCVGMGACSDALRVQRVITTLLEDVQVYEKDARLLSLCRPAGVVLKKEQNSSPESLTEAKLDVKGLILFCG